jgi:hypothetical protein
VCAPLNEPPTVWCPEVTVTVLIVPLAAVTVIPLPGLTLWRPSPGVMCSCAEAEALAALREAAGVVGAGGPLEQAAASRPATPVTAVIASQRPGPAVLPRRAARVCVWPSALSFCRTADPPVAGHSLLVVATPAVPGRSTHC